MKNMPTTRRACISPAVSSGALVNRCGRCCSNIFRLSPHASANSCARFQVADIGFKGIVQKVKQDDGNFVDAEAFQVHLGGQMGTEAAFGRKFRGLKVSDSPFDAIEPYLGFEGLDVFIGQEPLTLQGMKRGAIGSVSGLASAWPEVVASLVHDRSQTASARVTELREGLAGIPFHAALKEVLVSRGVLKNTSVRPPLRGLTDDERAKVLALGR